MPADHLGITMNGKLIQLGGDRFEPGYWLGIRQSSVQVALRLTQQNVDDSVLRQFDALLASLCNPTSDGAFHRALDKQALQHPILGRVLNMSMNLLEVFGMPVVGGACAMKLDSDGRSWKWLVGLPAIKKSIRAPQASLNFSCLLINELYAGREVQVEAAKAALEKLAKQFRPLAPKGLNTLRFLDAAHELGIPWLNLANNVYQFGWGIHSRWLDSSFTDETSNISAGLARDKVTCAALLREAGLPVPDHQLARNADHAVKVAETLGYPVVVKPANLDGGVGVMVGLHEAEAVRDAFTANSKLSHRVLVEKFVEGADHRLVVVKNEVLWVVMRRAARVIGDGIHTVKELVEQTNRLREVQTQALDPRIEQGSKPISIDDEALNWLRGQGLDLDDVVASGVSVRLRGAANWSQGGTTRDVLHEAHPDNLELAVAAAAAMRLDIAGIDLLIPDIAISWRQSGGVICEVNAQPQFTVAGRHKQVLERLLTKQGRIPLVLILGSALDDLPEFNLIKRRLAANRNVQWCHTALECRRALGLKQTELLVFCHEGAPSVLEGLPFDQADLIIEIGFETTVVPGTLLGNASDHWILEKTPESISTLTSQLERWVIGHVVHNPPDSRTFLQDDSDLSTAL